MSAWIDQMFSANIVQQYGIVRRSVDDVEKYASFDELLAYVKERQYHLIRTGDQFVVICNPGVLQIHC